MKNTTEIRDKIVTALIPAVAFDGWTLAAAERAALESGYDKDMIRAVFCNGLNDIVSHFADMADRAMLDILDDPAHLKIRERVTLAAQKRLEWLSKHKEAERQAVAYWMRPLRKYQGAKIVWRTADVIWNWAGDRANDYNRYTKRALLSGVLASTTLYWLQDEGRNLSATFAFLDRRIENVMQWGKMIGEIRNFKQAQA